MSRESIKGDQQDVADVDSNRTRSVDWNSVLPPILEPSTSRSAVLPLVIIRSTPEDFQVDEIPAYLPDGTGEHLYLWIEKRNLAAADLISNLARTLQIKARDIGVAGQKDKRAITRQFVSVPRESEARLSHIDSVCMKLLCVSAHGNKLRTGHLAGNRFRIVLRRPDAQPFSNEYVAAARNRLEEIARNGFPNYFGPQRFGHRGSSVTDGVALLRDPSKLKRWKPSQRRFMSRMVVSAVQAAVFNGVLNSRLRAGTHIQPVDGDVVCRRDGIRPFLFAEASERSEELVPMGPLPGPKMVAATGMSHQMEQNEITALGLTTADFAASAKRTPGARRKMIVWPRCVAVHGDSSGTICLSFELPAGSYATVLLTELATQVNVSRAANAASC